MKNKKEDYGMDLKDIRAEIDEIDSQLVELLLRRMNCSEEVAIYKAENNMPIFNNCLLYTSPSPRD